jgi:hypothetical protein
VFLDSFRTTMVCVGIGQISSDLGGSVSEDLSFINLDSYLRTELNGELS